MYDNWEELEQSIIGCTKCKLCSNRNNIVFGYGNKKASIMLIGEGPGVDEDLQKMGIQEGDTVRILDFEFEYKE